MNTNWERRLAETKVKMRVLRLQALPADTRWDLVEKEETITTWEQKLANKKCAIVYCLLLVGKKKLGWPKNLFCPVRCASPNHSL